MKGKLSYLSTDFYSGEKKLKSDDEYEITTCLHGDEEFVYVIDCRAKSLKCYKAGWDEPYESIVVPDNECEIPE